MITLYHNPRCSKSREALALLQDRGHAPQIVLYLESAPSEKTIKELVALLNINPRQLLRSGEAIYKELNLADTTLGDATLIKAMANNPKLIERPIAINGKKAVIGRPPENVLTIL